MKQLTLIAAIGLLAASAHALQLGDALPAEASAVKMQNVDGKEIAIADVKGETGTLVIFSCNHCPFVVNWEERTAALGNEARKHGVGVIQINPNDPKVAAGDSLEGMQKRAKERGFEFPYVVDATSAVARAFGATRTPEYFLFDAAGKLVYHGALDDNHKNPESVEATYLKDALAAVKEGKEVATKTSKIIGCTIKFRPQS